MSSDINYFFEKLLLYFVIKELDKIMRGGGRMILIIIKCNIYKVLQKGEKNDEKIILFVGSSFGWSCFCFL